jgi:hypothetical protein
MFYNVLKSYSKKITSNISNLSKRAFAEIIPSSELQAPSSVLKKPIDILSENSKSYLGFTSEEIGVAIKTGSDLYLTREKLSQLEKSGFFFNDVNGTINLNNISQKGWKLNYLKNMLLLQDYNTIFRDFLQSTCLNDRFGLNLTCENRFKNYIESHLYSINKKGYNLDLESLKIKQDFKILRVELYKNLKINRDENKNFSKYEFKTYSTPVGPLVVAHEKGNDHSLAKDNKPFILATTMHVRSPMKIGVFNQNLKRKLHGFAEEEIIDYVVRFETQLNFSELFWILPTQNKPKRLRSTKITDLNNVMRGNPYFVEKFDLVDDNLRNNYMTKDIELDNDFKRYVRILEGQKI